MKKDEDQRSVVSGQNVPGALRICLRCGELAAGVRCEGCAEIERESERLAWQLRRMGARTIYWPEDAPMDLASQLLRVLTEEKFDKLRNEQPAPLATGQRYAEESAKAARMLSGAFYLSLCVCFAWYMVWAFRGFILDCLDLWFGWRF